MKNLKRYLARRAQDILGDQGIDDPFYIVIARLAKNLREELPRNCQKITQNEIDERIDLDFNFIFNTKKIWGVDYLYWHDQELGAIN